jgi:hypothetical protein
MTAKLLVHLRGRASGHRLIVERGALRVTQVPLIKGTPAGKVAARGSGGNPFDVTQCVSWAWEKRSDIYDRAVAAGVPRWGLRPHPAFKYD